MKTCFAMLVSGCFSFVPFYHFPRFDPSMQTIADIPLPQGFERIELHEGSFAAYLRALPLRKDNTVYLYNGSVKSNQSLHYAVLDVSTGNKDLQQCADAIMRLRAEYFFNRKMYDSITFPKGTKGVYRFSPLRGNTITPRQQFLKFMETVFINCGTYTLEQSLKPVKNISQMQPGNVFVKGGAPGHAEIVVDMAINKKTKQKIFLLAEGYMPAQDMHIVLNLTHTALGPWYALENDKEIVTATWTFDPGQLRKW